MKYRNVLLYAIVLLATVATAFALPDGANANAGTPQTKTANAADSVVAEGGNITTVNLNGESQTNVWQGFYGNVSGNLTLQDASGDVMYNWTLLTAEGEVYASRNSTIDFTTVAGVEVCTVDETLTGTGTDRVNNTFSNASVNFDIGAINIPEACEVFTHVNSQVNTSTWPEIITSATGVTSIYVTKINASETAFDGTAADYQMIVPDFANASTSTYFFFVEFS